MKGTTRVFITCDQKNLARILDKTVSAGNLTVNVSVTKISRNSSR